MEVTKITKEDSPNVDWLLKDKGNGLETNGLSEVCRILIDKVNLLIEDREGNPDVDTESKLNLADVTITEGQFCPHCGRRKRQKGDGTISWLCEC